MTFPERNDQSERTASALAKLNPKHWTRKTKLIAVGAVLALVLAGAGGMAVSLARRKKHR